MVFRSGLLKTYKRIKITQSYTQFIIPMKKINNIFLIPILFIFCLTACKEDLPQDSIVEEEMDVELKSLIASKGGLAYFTLPNSNDYDNIPQDPNNPISSHRVILGKKLFYETGLATNPMMSESMETYSCATCHVPGSSFQAGIRQGIGDGGMGIGIAGEGRFANPNYEEILLDVPPIRVPNNMNTAYIVNAAWDGKLGATGANVGTEDLWVDDVFLETNNLGYTGIETQAIAGLEFHRMIVEPSLIENSYYKDMFDYSFPEFPEEERYTFETAGLAIAAFERSMLTNQAPFQDWLKGDSEALTMEQKLGAVLFFDKANCVACHNSPSLNSNEFHAIGMGDLEGDDVLGDFGDFVDVVSRGRGGFTGNPSDDYKFKTPQLYNLKNTNFLGHGATFTNLREVVEYKNEALQQNGDVPSSQLSGHFIPLGLTEQEMDQLVDFLENGLYDPNMHRYVPQTVASGNCFPNNDLQSQEDMGCGQ